VDEHVKIKIGTGFPERSQFGRIERQVLQFGSDHHAAKTELDGATLQLGGGFRGFERRHMREADEPAGMRPLRFAHAIVDQAAGCDIGLVETRSAGEHAGIDPAQIHHTDVGGKIGQQRIEQIMRIAVAIEIGGELAGLAFEQFRRGVMLLKVDEHLRAIAFFPLPLWERVASVRRKLRTRRVRGIASEAARANPSPASLAIARSAPSPARGAFT
jgi:hypothetical protein